MDDREHSQLSQIHDLLKRRKELIDIKLQLQKDVHVTQPCNFGSKFDTLPKEKVVSVADGLHHRFMDQRFLQALECHMLCGLRVVNYDTFKLAVQFRASYIHKILPEVYAVYLLAENNGNYSVEKYYLPYSIQMKALVHRWSPLKNDNLKNFLMDIKQQINAFHHRQNQILQLKEWANNQKITLEVFHPLSCNYVIVTSRMDDNLKLMNCRSLNLVLHYDSNCYLPTTIDIDSSDLAEEDLAAAKEQFSAFKLYTLREAFEISSIKTERFSLTNPESIMEEVSNEDFNGEDNEVLVDKSSVSSSVSVGEDNISDVSAEAVSEKLQKFRTRSQVRKESRSLSIIQEARKSKPKPSTKGKRNVALERRSNPVQTKNRLKKLSSTDRNVPKKKKSPDELLHTKQQTSLHHSTNTVTKEFAAPDQTNKITSYFLRSKTKQH